MHTNLQISNHEDPLSGRHRGNGVVEFIEAVEAPEWQAVIGPELHPHVYEFMPQRYGVHTYLVCVHTIGLQSCSLAVGPISIKGEQAAAEKLD